MWLDGIVNREVREELFYAVLTGKSSGAVVSHQSTVVSKNFSG
jgi:hypothetical protein